MNNLGELTLVYGKLYYCKWAKRTAYFVKMYEKTVNGVDITVAQFKDQRGVYIECNTDTLADNLLEIRSAD